VATKGKADMYIITAYTNIRPWLSSRRSIIAKPADRVDSVWKWPMPASV
jgi:hypothetical protein